MPDSQDIDAAIVAKLAGDATLAALMQSGAFVFMDQAPPVDNTPGSGRFVIVSLITGEDVQQFGGRSFEDALYSVEARMLSTAGGNIKAAAARIDALLDHGTLTVAGYSLMTLYREERTRITEVDAVDASIRWYRRGGQYRVVMST
jgi:hypothetical protein